MSTIKRAYDRQKVVILSGAAQSSGGLNSGIIDLTGMAGGLVRIPAAWTAADISFRAVTQQGSTGFAPVIGNPPKAETGGKVRQQTGGLLALIENIVTNEVGYYPIPVEALQAGYVYLVSTNTASEVDVNQAADREVWVILKG